MRYFGKKSLSSVFCYLSGIYFLLALGMGGYEIFDEIILKNRSNIVYMGCLEIVNEHLYKIGMDYLPLFLTLFVLQLVFNYCLFKLFWNMRLEKVFHKNNVKQFRIMGIVFFIHVAAWTVVHPYFIEKFNNALIPLSGIIKFVFVPRVDSLLYGCFLILVAELFKRGIEEKDSYDEVI